MLKMFSVEIMNKVPPSVCRLIARASHVLISLSISLCGTVLYLTLVLNTSKKNSQI